MAGVLETVSYYGKYYVDDLVKKFTSYAAIEFSLGWESDNRLVNRFESRQFCVLF